MASTVQHDGSSSLTAGSSNGPGSIATASSSKGLFSLRSANPSTNTSMKWSRPGASSTNLPIKPPLSTSFGNNPTSNSIVVTSPMSSKLDSPMFRERMTTLMHQGDSYAKKLDFERRRAYELDACLHSMRDFHFETKKKLFTAIENGSVPASEAPSHLLSGNASTGMGSTATTHPVPPNAAKAAAGGATSSSSSSGSTSTSNTSNTTSASNAERKSIRILENRLDKVLTKYNEICNANKLLREEIQTLRREKVSQQHIHDKLDRELHAKQSEMQKVTSATQNAYDARDRANRQVEALRAHATSENDEFELGWVEKMQQLEEDRQSIRDIPRLRTPKNQQQQRFRGGGGAMTHRHGMGPGGGTTGLAKMTMTSTSPTAPGGAATTTGTATATGFKLLSTPELKLRDETIKNVRLINEKEIDLRKQSERLKVVEDALIKIKKKTAVNDVTELANAIVASEEKNFSLFNLINELNTEMKALEIENNEIATAIERCKGSGRNSDSYRRQLKHDLETQIEKSKQKVLFFETRHADTADTMEAMKNGAFSIYHKIGSHQHAIIAPVSTTTNAATTNNNGAAAGNANNGANGAAGGANGSAGSGGGGSGGGTAGGGAAGANGAAATNNATASASANLATNEESFTQQMLSHGITDVNMIKLLGLIEQRVEEIVDIHNLATYATTTPHFKTQHDPTEAKHPGRHDKKGGHHASIYNANVDGGVTNATTNGGGVGTSGSSSSSAGGGGGAGASAGANGLANINNLLRPLPPAAEDFNDSDSEEQQQEENANCILRPAKIAEIQEKTAAAVGRRKDKQHTRAAARRVA